MGKATYSLVALDENLLDAQLTIEGVPQRIEWRHNKNTIVRSYGRMVAAKITNSTGSFSAIVHFADGSEPAVTNDVANVGTMPDPPRIVPYDPNAPAPWWKRNIKALALVALLIALPFVARWSYRHIYAAMHQQSSEGISMGPTRTYEGQRPPSNAQIEARIRREAAIAERLEAQAAAAPASVNVPAQNAAPVPALRSIDTITVADGAIAASDAQRYIENLSVTAFTDPLKRSQLERDFGVKIPTLSTSIGQVYAFRSSSGELYFYSDTGTFRVMPAK